MLAVQQTCPDCGNHDFFLNRQRGEAICRSCSTVVDEAMVDLGSDSRFFEDDGGNSNSRTGAPFDPRVANHLSTQIGNSADFSKLSGRSRAMMSRIRKRNSWANTSFEHSLRHALSHMKMISGRLGLPNVVEKDASEIYRRAVERGLTLKRSKDDIVVAALFLACKRQTVPRGMRELAEAGKTDLKVLGKTYKLLLRELGIKLAPTSPVDYVAKFASKLNLSQRIQTKAVKLILELDKKAELSGLSPISVAASTLYIAGLVEKEKRTQREIAEATGITEATLRARCRRMANSLKIKLKVR